MVFKFPIHNWKSRIEVQIHPELFFFFLEKESESLKVGSYLVLQLEVCAF